MPERRPPAWVRALLRLCLLTWPEGRRRSHGAALLGATGSLLADAAERGTLPFLREVAGEAAGLIRTGLAMRGARAGGAVRAAARGWAADLRLAVRALLRAPAFTAVVVATLAIGIGANAVVFGLARGVLLAAPPYDDPGELLLVWNTLPGSDERIPVAGPDVAELRRRAARLDGVAFHTRVVDGAIETAAGDDAEHVRLASVTPDFFRVLGVEPALGGGFVGGEGAPRADRTGGTGADEHQAPAPSTPGAVTVAVLSHGTWQRLFGSDPGVVGRTVSLNGVGVEVVGVLPADFRLVLPPEAGVGTDVDVWTPLLVPLASLHRDERLLDQDSDNSGAAVARIAPGATLSLAREEVRRIGRELRAEVPSYEAAGLGMDARPLGADATAHARPVLLALMAGAAAVLLVACLNVAGLVVARGAARSGELAVRLALGAGRGRILRQTAAEGLVLVGAGLAAALALARVAGAALPGLLPPRLVPPAWTPALDPVTLAAAAGAAAVAVLLAGVLPAWRVAAMRAPGSLRASGGRTGAVGGHTRRGLVVAEVAFSVVLLVAAGLLLRTVEALREVRPGFEPRHAVTFDLSLRVPDRYRSPATRAALMKDVQTRLEALPGVRAAGWVGVLPLSGDRWTQPWGLPGQPVDAWRENRADFRVASSGWFEAVGARLIEGRGFTEREDLEEDERVVIVDRTLARRVAPGGSAVGAVIGVPVDGAPVEARIVGVVEPIRYETLEAVGREAIYVPYRQEASRDVSFVVRTDPGAAADLSTLAPAVRAAVREVDPRVPIHDLRTLEAYVAGALAPRRFALGLLAVFAVLALACSAVALYGVVAFDVGRRTREIGVRMAIGASPGRTVRGVLGGGMRLAGAGLLLGVPLALVGARSMRSLVFGVGAADPATWTAVVAVVGGVTLLATWIPARRASRLDPGEALRVE